MRDFQTKANLGAVPDANTTTKLGGGEVTSLRTEAKTAVSRAGLALAPQDGTNEDTTQLAQALFINGTSASSFQDGGAADAIALTPVTGSAGLVLPPDYTTLDGAEVSFFAAFANLTTTPTASIGQTGGTQFGVKTITREDGTALTVSDINTTVMTTLKRDDASDTWLLTRGAGTQIAAGAANVMGQISKFYSAGPQTAAAFEVIVADTSGGVFTVNLPVTPTQGDFVSFEVGSDFTVNALTIGRNGETIMGVAADFVVGSNHAVAFRYDGADWRFSIGGADIADQSVTIATTSGNFKDLNIPDGVTRMTVMLRGCNFGAATAADIIRLGYSGGAVVSGYEGGGASLGTGGSQLENTTGLYSHLGSPSPVNANLVFNREPGKIGRAHV